MENKVVINRVLTGCIISLIGILCINLLIRLRKRLPARVNCWFCNSNDWVPYSLRNSFFCKGCHQYNGFNSDGGYNIALDVNATKSDVSSCVRRCLPPSDNSLCYSCNKNQQLKVMQLSNFKPLNEKNFDLEVDAFRLHLENVYRLCSHCRRVVKQRLVSEKRQFLGAKLLLARQDHDSASRNDKIITSFNLFKIFLYKSLRVTAFTYLVFVLLDCYFNLNMYVSKKTISSAQKYLKNYLNSFSNTTVDGKNVTKAGNIDTFTNLNYLVPALVYNFEIPFFDYLNLESFNFDSVSIYLNGLPSIEFCVDIFAILGFFLQFILQIFDFKISFCYFINDVAWIMSLALTRLSVPYLHLIQLILGMVTTFYPIKRKITSVKNIKNIVSKKMQNISDSRSPNQDNDDQLSDDSDVDIGFNKTSTPEGNQRPIGFVDFPMRYRKIEDSRSVFSNSQYNNSMNYSFRSEDPYFSKPHARLPDFNMMQKRHYDTDSHLNKGIGSLTLGKQNLSPTGKNVFSTRQYDCNPFMFGASPPSSPRPVLSPSRLSPTGPQSWVAGGYWANDNLQQAYDLHSASRSSSQSSGFESQASSAYQRNINSPSTLRAESFFNDCNHTKKFDLFSNSSARNNCNQSFQSYSPPNSPIYPNIHRKESSFMANQAPWSSSTMRGLNASIFHGSERTFAPTIRSNSNDAF